MVVIDTRERCYVKYTKYVFCFFAEVNVLNQAVILKFSFRVDICMTSYLTDC